MSEDIGQLATRAATSIIQGDTATGRTLIHAFLDKIIEMGVASHHTALPYLQSLYKSPKADLVSLFTSIFDMYVEQSLRDMNTLEAEIQTAKDQLVHVAQLKEQVASYRHQLTSLWGADADFQTVETIRQFITAQHQLEIEIQTYHATLTTQQAQIQQLRDELKRMMSA